LRDFRRRASGAHLVTYLVEAGTSLDDVVLAEARVGSQPCRAQADVYWLQHCETTFADASTQPGLSVWGIAGCAKCR
jgi:hypothetical protein